MSEWKSAKYWRMRPVEERVRNLRVPPRYRSASFETFEANEGSPEEALLSAVIKWTNSIEKRMEDGTGLYVYGKTGVGKTHLAVSALKAIVTAHNLSGLFLPYDLFVEMVHDARNNDGELPEMYGDPNLLKYIRRVYDILVIDNLNSDRLTEYMAKTISNVIESRYEMQLPTIITTEIRPDKLATLYSPRVQSIIRESCFDIYVASDDYRMK
jgi:DNA replication protein DnaC